MMTLSKLASLAHVSLSTASKAFSMSSEVNEETRKMIFALAREHGCFKKFYNAKYPKLVIAVICPEFRSRYYSSLVSSIQESLAEKGCEICVASTDFSQSTLKDLYEYYNNYSTVDGIIMIDCSKEALSENNVPIVTNRRSKLENATLYPSGIDLAIDYFLSKGVFDIGFIGEAHTGGKFRDFKKYMSEKNIKFREEHISISEKRLEGGGYEAMEELFKRNAVPRAIICAYDCMAIGAMKCIFDKGLKIPEDVAVIGMNNNRESEFLNPPLSSVGRCVEKMGKELAETMINNLMGKGSCGTVIIEPKLILRRSSEI